MEGQECAFHADVIACSKHGAFQYVIAVPAQTLHGMCCLRADHIHLAKQFARCLNGFCKMPEWVNGLCNETDQME